MKKINVAKLLKDCPQNMELDCAMWENVTLKNVVIGDTFPIKVAYPLNDGDTCTTELTKYGGWSNVETAKCVIFPKGKTTWEGFVPPCKFKDGDIVYYNYTIAIFKEWGDETLFRTYVTTYLSCDSFIDMNVPLFGKSVRKEIRFATEEEKQKLFDAIKANGYKWSSETKTLEKLYKPKFKVGDRIRHKNDKTIIRTINYIYNYNDSYGLCDGHLLFFKEQDDYELVPNKFDINTLKPFDKVLIRLTNNCVWMPKLFSHYDTGPKVKYYPFVTIDNIGYPQCIPYNGNEHLCRKTYDCDEFYKTWK